MVGKNEHTVYVCIYIYVHNEQQHQIPKIGLRYLYAHTNIGVVLCAHPLFPIPVGTHIHLLSAALV